MFWVRHGLQLIYLWMTVVRLLNSERQACRTCTTVGLVGLVDFPRAANTGVWECVCKFGFTVVRIGVGAVWTDSPPPDLQVTTR